MTRRDPDPAATLCAVFDEHRVNAHFGADKPDADLYPDAESNFLALEGRKRGLIERPGALASYARWNRERGFAS